MKHTQHHGKASPFTSEHAGDPNDISRLSIGEELEAKDIAVRHKLELSLIRADNSGTPHRVTLKEGGILDAQVRFSPGDSTVYFMDSDHAAFARHNIIEILKVEPLGPAGKHRANPRNSNAVPMAREEIITTLLEAEKELALAHSQQKKAEHAPLPRWLLEVTVHDGSTHVGRAALGKHAERDLRQGKAFSIINDELEQSHSIHLADLVSIRRIGGGAAKIPH